MKDKIQEELKKEIEERKKLLTDDRFVKVNGEFIPSKTYLWFLQGRYSQHLATKQAMIKDELKFLEELSRCLIGKWVGCVKMVEDEIVRLDEEQKLGELRT